MSLSKRTRFKVFDRDDYKCRYCGKTPEDGITLEVDHIHPTSKGGTNELHNLVTSCFDCNRGKSDLPVAGNHEEPASVRMKRLQEVSESKRLAAELKMAERQRAKEEQDWVDVICREFGTDSCPKRLAADGWRLAREFGATTVFEWINILARKFDRPSMDCVRYLCGIARKYREEMGQ
jgi:hypothetical protein